MSSINTTHALAAAYMSGQFWMLHRPVLCSLVEVFNRHAAGLKLDGAELKGITSEKDDRKEKIRMEYDGLVGIDPGSGADAGDRPMYFRSGSVAVVPVHGMICKYAGMVGGFSQPDGMSADRIIRAMTLAHSDTRCTSVVLDIDSPGGTVAGGEDLIAAARSLPKKSGKDMVAFAHDLCASGAMLVAAQCSKVFTGASAFVGSCGVYQVVEDASEYYAERGIKKHVVASGPHKGSFADGTAVTPEQLQDLSREIGEAADWYVQRTLIEGRGLDANAAAAIATGQCWVGQRAVDIGLADGVTTLGELIDAMQE